ncbi:MAG TPA: ATP-binding protein [Steroidobacteraceae bacterium]|nr:ATP-binding protein [Steroidobacteraceae bacterium]
MPAGGWRLSFWPRSLFGQLFVAVFIGVVAATLISVFLVSRERDRTLVQASVREWSRRVVDMTASMQLLQPSERNEASVLLQNWPRPQFRRPRPPPGPVLEPLFAPPGMPTPIPDFRQSLEEQLRFVFGPGYQVSVVPTTNPTRTAMTLSRPGAVAFERGGQLYDVSVGIPGGDTLLFRLAQGQRVAPLPRSLLFNLGLLALLIAIAVYAVTRGITRPLSDLARAAEAVGRDLRQPALIERGSREVRDAARAFNTMQERMQRHVDSRTRVLAAMSHDLKTPLTRLRLRMATLEDQDLQSRVDRDLDEMENMVRGALALLRGLNDDEPAEAVDINELLTTLQAEFAEMGAPFAVTGRARRLYAGKPMALKRCLTNLISNATKFGGGVSAQVEDGSAVIIHIRDQGPGIAPEHLARVFEPFYRVESSRNRDTGGTGLGLCIARDIAQAHGGALTLQNLPQRGLQATLTLPRSG